MKTTFPLIPEGKHPERVLEAVKHEIRKDLKRQRRRDLPPGADFWDFDCAIGLDAESAVAVHLGDLLSALDQWAQQGAQQVHIKAIAKAGQRKARAPGEPAPTPATMDGDADGKTDPALLGAPLADGFVGAA